MCFVLVQAESWNWNTGLTTTKLLRGRPDLLRLLDLPVATTQEENLDL
jgi:hypothetical protein